MCGRFTITHPNEAIAALFDALPGNDLPPVPRFNICPTQPVAAILSDGGQRRLRAQSTQNYFNLSESEKT